MKWLVLAIVVIGVLAWLRSSGRRDDAERPGVDRTRAKAPAAPQEIVACAQCGLHLPLADSIAGPTGARYCCDAHRTTAESTRRPP